MSYDRNQIASEHVKRVASALSVYKLITLEQLSGILDGFKEHQARKN